MNTVKHVSISILCAPEKVYAFASNGENLTQWASGLSGAQIEKSGEFWVSDSPMGKVKVKFAPNNSFGVMDHDVYLPSGEINTNPFRVVKNAEGCEVTFTVFKLAGVSEEDFEKDVHLIETDLKKLKSLM